MVCEQIYIAKASRKWKFIQPKAELTARVPAYSHRERREGTKNKIVEEQTLLRYVLYSSSYSWQCDL